MEYSIAKKHLKRIVPKKHCREVLKGVYHKGNEVKGTDSKRLLACEIDNINFKELIVNINNDEVVEGNYPITDNLFLDYPSIVLNLDIETIKSLKRVVHCIKQLGYKYIQLVKKDDYWYVETNDEKLEDKADMKGKIEYQLVKDVESEEQTRLFQTVYLLNALDFIIDTKEDTQLVMMLSPHVPIQFNNVAYSDNVYKYLIMPVRIY